MIITSYNQARELEKLLGTIRAQSVQPSTIIVADDGSSDGTQMLCKQHNIQFLTQPDQGYRKAQILNEALRVAQSQYILFIDADTLLEKHFVEDHLKLAQKDHFVCGRRVDLGRRVSQRPDPLAWRHLIHSALIGETHGLKRALRLPEPLRMLLGYTKAIDILGSNWSAWRSDIFAVNGFSENQNSYWGEDGDIYIRLRNMGKKATNAKGKCIQFHQWHTRRTPNPATVARYQELLLNKTYTWAPDGIYRTSL